MGCIDSEQPAIPSEEDRSTLRPLRQLEFVEYFEQRDQRPLRRLEFVEHFEQRDQERRELGPAPPILTCDAFPTYNKKKTLSEDENFRSESDSNSDSDSTSLLPSQFRKLSITRYNRIQDKIIELNVGGQHFTTTYMTLTARYPQSMLAILVYYYISYPEPNLSPSMRDLDGRLFIEQDGPSFELLLGFLRTNVMDLEKCTFLRKLRQVADYFCIEDAVTLIEAEIERRDLVEELQNRIRLYKDRLKSATSHLDVLKTGTPVLPAFANIGDMVKAPLIKLSGPSFVGKIVGVRRDRVWVQWDGDSELTEVIWKDKTGLMLDYA
ncbi:BTB/POZ protein [Phlyctochytrium arcticum]|nr:BTB/POZ protein [Phlyctochytrium arcticum]